MDEIILTKFLRFRQTQKPSESRKTYTYQVENSAKEDIIGWISWFPGWRRYVFCNSNQHVILDKVCMQQIIELIDRLEAERAEKIS